MANNIKPRIGLIVPSVQSVTEPLFNRILGEEFDFLAHRMRLAGGKVEDLIAMEKGIPDAVIALQDAGAELLVYCCAGSGAIQGKEKELELCRRVEAEFSIPMISTMDCCVQAFRSLGAEKITMVGPNTPEVGHTEVVYIEKEGFRVVRHYGFGIEDGRLFSRIDRETIKEKAIANWDEQSDTMFIACMNWHATDVIGNIHRQIGKHVVTSHSATMWKIYCMQRTEIPYSDFVHQLYQTSIGGK